MPKAKRVQGIETEDVTYLNIILPDLGNYESSSRNTDARIGIGIRFQGYLAMAELEIHK